MRAVCVAHLLKKQQRHQVITERRKRKKSKQPIAFTFFHKSHLTIRFRPNMVRVAVTYNKIANNKNSKRKLARKVFQRQIEEANLITGSYRHQSTFTAEIESGPRLKREYSTLRVHNADGTIAFDCFLFLFRTHRKRYRMEYWQNRNFELAFLWIFEWMRDMVARLANSYTMYFTYNFIGCHFGFLFCLCQKRKLY